MAHDLQSLRRVAQQARVVPGSMGLRFQRVFVVQREWDGDNAGDSSSAEIRTEILEAGYPPKVREATGEEIALNSLDSGTYNIGPITPYWSSGGSTGGTRYETLKPTIEAQASELYYEILNTQTGESKKYRLASIDTDRSFRYMIRVAPLESNI